MCNIHCRKLILPLLVAALIATLSGAALAAPLDDCNGQLNITIAPNTAGIDGSVYHVNLSLGTGSITGGAANTMSLTTVRYFLDCTFAGLPGCTDDGDVIHFVNNVTTNCPVTPTATTNS